LKRRRAHRYPPSEVIRAACLAVTGSSAPEIADALGNMTSTSRVFRILRLNGIRLVPKTQAQTAFVIVIARETMAEIERISEPFGADPQFVAARVLEKVVSDNAVLREIVKGVVHRD
jgi:hypothetical protein